MICKNCNKEIELYFGGFIHSWKGTISCGLVAEPCIKINRKLDAATILAEMEARRPTPIPAHREYNPNNVGGTFVGEL